MRFVLFVRVSLLAAESVGDICVWSGRCRPVQSSAGTLCALASQANSLYDTGNKWDVAREGIKRLVVGAGSDVCCNYIGTLGDDARSACTCGAVWSGAEGCSVCGGQISTLGASVGVGGSCVRRMGSFIGAVTSLAGIETANRSGNWWSARICSLPIVLNGDAGTGFIIASTSILDASAELLPDNMVGMEMSCGKNSTVHTICSLRVFVIYAVWHL